ncbi:NAD(P) transhydrogenase [Platysternon megacephalum]|uniref:NAD(P) transhydrogenase n=1 Tax=Platysternon megacephalum TaxID=55544 RepID=A0A4D9EYC6_9SAUR|nr:NAD(P) transhydrogenase [Platysternon megacephalum]
MHTPARAGGARDTESQTLPPNPSNASGIAPMLLPLDPAQAGTQPLAPRVRLTPYLTATARFRVPESRGGGTLLQPIKTAGCCAQIQSCTSQPHPRWQPPPIRTRSGSDDTCQSRTGTSPTNQKKAKHRPFRFRPLAHGSVMWLEAGSYGADVAPEERAASSGLEQPAREREGKRLPSSQHPACRTSLRSSTFRAY